MTISLELIDELRKRTNCSYEEAKILLEKHNGNLVEAIVEFERNNSSKFNQNNNNNISFGTKVKQLISKGFKTKFVVEKSGETIINIPINILIIAAIFLNWMLFMALIICFVFGFRFKILKEKGESVDINRIINSFGSKVKDATDSERHQNNQNYKDNSGPNKKNSNTDHDDDGYNEITIE